ncbi:hypothetical protein [Pseudomonas sp. 460]|uniref:hypothetical protein n=1 Tax=Pseudomonas sp. 460 TaxID=2485142 RepID=UPI0010491889|nr:hypothetical protein [Pseudomonas sp. 460]TCV51361.1 hypothetical protein EDB99_10727 [Pseudomonas sp. 460]
MPRASSRLPKRITLHWGSDRLEVDDPTWIRKIVQEMAQNSPSAENEGICLFEPHSRRLERMEASLEASGFASRYVDPKAPPKLFGYEAPEEQGPVAVEALRVFLGLELPVALNFTDYNGRSTHRMSAVHTFFRQSWHYRVLDELNLCWMFNGYQLYANHQIGTMQYRPFPSEGMGHIERRLLNAQWVRLGFDGASTPPAGRHWSWHRRTFVLAANGIQRIGRDDLDLEPEYDDREVEDDAEDGIRPSQEVI